MIGLQHLKPKLYFILSRQMLMHVYNNNKCDTGICK